MTPFKIFGNTYFIGTYQASCHLIDTGDGLIMIDPGYKGYGISRDRCDIQIRI